MKTVTRSTCCYCGVGCGVLIESEAGVMTGIRGDPDHPANMGRLCTKGLSLPQTASATTGRALFPELRYARHESRQPVDWDTALDHVAGRFAEIIREHGPDAVAFYVSGQLLTEDYYVFNKLAKGLIGTNNIDTNSRLCMSSAVSGYKMAFGADGPPTCYEDLELADCVLFAGSNMAYAHPVLFRRLEAVKEARNARWIVVDPRRTATAAMADLHLAIQPGSDVALFNGMLHHLIWEGRLDLDYIAQSTDDFDALKRALRDYHPKRVAQRCGITETDLLQAAEWFAESPASLSLYCMGLNQSSHGTDKNLALINLHLATGQMGKPGAGPFSLTGQPNAMGGREVGGLATTLAAHRDIQNPQHRAEVARLWGVQALNPKPGLPAVAMFEALREGSIKAIFIVCTNPAHSMPNLNAVHEALRHAELVVVQEAFAHTDTTAFADVLLPASSWGEKNGTVTNSERRISRVCAAVNAPGEARHDWWIGCEFARRLEAQLHPDQPTLFPYGEPESIFNEHRALTVGRDLDIGGLSYAKLETAGPQQWPFPAGAIAGQARRYTEGRFATDNGRARFHVTDDISVAEEVSAHYPFHLLTGRLRDQWHGMSRTGRVPQLFAHAPEPTLTMHPQDAQRRGLKAGQWVRVQSRHGELVLPLAVGDDVQSGSVFAAMHWNGQFMQSAGINHTLFGAVDRHSAQPELKHVPVRVEPVDLPWTFTLAVRSNDVLALKEALQPALAARTYAAISLLAEDILLLRAASEEADEAWANAVLAQSGLHTGADVLEYRDVRRGILKRVRWQNDSLISFVVSGSNDDGSRWLDLLQNKTPWIGPRIAIFAPNDANRAPRDRIICNCKQVKESAIRLHLAAGESIDELKQSLGCGSVCGSCVPEIKQLSMVMSGKRVAN